MTDKAKHIVALADDDADDREIFVDVCLDIEADIKVFLFKNGKELIDYLSAADNVIPSILFLDINMPIKDGFECLKSIRCNLGLNELCVIVYSTSISLSDVKKARDLGADGFLQKPASYKSLKSAVQNILDTDWSDPCSQLDEMNFLINA